MKIVRGQWNRSDPGRVLYLYLTTKDLITKDLTTKKGTR